MLEQQRVVVRDPLHVARQKSFEIRLPREAAKAREAAQRDGVVRQALRLLVGDHLQAMLDFAQERDRRR